MIENFLICIIAYWLSDFIVRTQLIHRFLQNKTEVIYGGAFLVAGIMVAILLGSWSIQLAMAIFLISLLYVALSKWVEKKYLTRTNLSTYLASQAIHISTIYLGLIIFGQAPGPLQLISQLHILLFADQLIVDKNLYIPTIIMVVLFLIGIVPEMIGRFLLRFRGSIDANNSINEIAAGTAINDTSELLKNSRESLIRRIHSDALIEEQLEVSNDTGTPPKSKEVLKVQYHWYRKEEDLSRGRYIGILERLIVCLFVYFGVYQGLVLLGTMKTIARFKMFDSKSFAEYYLIGTLISLLMACLCGFLLQRILS